MTLDERGMVKQAKHAVQKRRDHVCAHCAAAFGQASHLTRHVHAVHEKRRDHACPHCDAVFGEAGSLTTHVRVVVHEKRRDHIELQPEDPDTVDDPD